MVLQAGENGEYNSDRDVFMEDGFKFWHNSAGVLCLSSFSFLLLLKLFYVGIINIAQGIHLLNVPSSTSRKPHNSQTQVGSFFIESKRNTASVFPAFRRHANPKNYEFAASSRVHEKVWQAEVALSALFLPLGLLHNAGERGAPGVNKSISHAENRCGKHSERSLFLASN